MRICGFSRRIRSAAVGFFQLNNIITGIIITCPTKGLLPNASHNPGFPSAGISAISISG